MFSLTTGSFFFLSARDSRVRETRAGCARREMESTLSLLPACCKSTWKTTFARACVFFSLLTMKGRVCLRAQWPNRPALIINSGFRRNKFQKRLGTPPPPPPPRLGGMLAHRKVIPSIMIAGTHLYTWVKRDNVE